MKFGKLMQRMSEVFGATVDKKVEAADKNIDIETYARRLLAQQRENHVKIESHRNELVRQQKEHEAQIAKSTARLKRIKDVVLHFSKLPDNEKTVAQQQQVLTAAHEGSLLEEQVAMLEGQIVNIQNAINKTVVNLGVVQRNTLSLESRLNNITFRNTMAKIKLATYTVEQTDTYFSLEKLDEIVDGKEVDANTAEAIHNLDNPELFQTAPTSAEDFLKKVLAEAK